MNAPLDLLAPDLERRFGGLRRLHGDAGYKALRSARVGLVGLGGVGSWAVEALARSGVAQLTLFDMDHVAESNINRQVQARGETLGQHKGEALRARIADIHPGCDVQVVDDFVTAANWPSLLPREIDVLIDACDQVQAKMAMAVWAREGRHDFVCVGAAGGKQKPQLVEVDDISRATHDPLLASMRQRLRKQHGAPRDRAMGVRCVFSREAVMSPADAFCDVGDDAGGAKVDGSLNCHGYGSSVVVTATFGLVAASEALQCVLRRLA
ncbi:tRNA threonylcarbamoyladenosine dehydratase [Piscinibacter gummiphilus]|uniref:tRNA threonylcarbamoyladenosine dehydratase n=1 Tax=Piscinibacter gummiphilus TaxID=946333 RepID=A0ABZ0CYR4_9BURK|nr:tRNA threonylcarbamoyladenosine dehydratase [Piscinibacter gummiphilus]WOB10089.1 tRNA threonylcarbamoyladenosine dehydratase [Piscinibacter gummiphilus]